MSLLCSFSDTLTNLDFDFEAGCAVGTRADNWLVEQDKWLIDVYGL